MARCAPRRCITNRSSDLREIERTQTITSECTHSCGSRSSRVSSKRKQRVAAATAEIEARVQQNYAHTIDPELRERLMLELTAVEAIVQAFKVACPMNAGTHRRIRVRNLCEG